MKKIILASASPRRHELLNLVNLKHEIRISDCEENIAYKDPADMVSRLSLIKASAVAKQLQMPEEKDALVIGADTIVFFKDKVLGKPKDKQEALAMLRALSGNTHTVFTGVSVIDAASGQTETFYEETKVTFYEFTDEELAAYVDSGDPMDKAGAYGVQGPGAFLVKKVKGDYFTVVGLPVAHLLQVLKKFRESRAK